MRIYLSFDFEGVAGVVDWSQCRPGDQGAYALGRRLTLGEVNAAIEGARAGGATEVLVNDAHGAMHNLDPDQLAGRARYVSGRHKPHYMMEGLDGSFDVVFLVGYHGSISGPSSTLSHTYNPEVFARVELDGAAVGESGINALVAQHFGVPIGLVTGDAVTQSETAPFAPSAVRVVTKDSVTRFAATHLHPEEAREQIHDGARVATERARAEELELPGLSGPVRLDLTLQTADMAAVGSWAKGAERLGTRGIRIESDDLLAAFRSFVAVTYITRQAGGR